MTSSAADWAALLDDFPAFCSLLRIETKERGVAAIPFHYERWHPEQRDFQRSRTGRDVVLKPRQIGFTTLELARDFWTAVRFEGSNVLIVCHDDDLKKRLLRALKLMTEWLARTPLLPPVGYDNVSEWTFPTIRSSIRVITVGKTERTAGEKGRGDTIHRAHLTEVAKWGPGEMEAWNAIEGSLTPDSEVVFESTAAGYGNLFHRMFSAAWEGRSEYRAHFWPWYSHPAYRAFIPDHITPTPRTDLERELVTRHGISPSQLLWWQHKVDARQDGKGGERLTVQEYPPDPERAFVTSGLTFFDSATLERIVSRVSPGRPIATARGIGSRLSREVLRGNLEVWVRPFAMRAEREDGDASERERFYIGADPAEGVGADESAAVVWTADGRYAARFAAQVPVDEFAEVLDALGRYYRDALLGVERNNHGHAVLLRLDQLRYPNLFPPPWMDPADVRARWPWHDGRLGWHTTTRTRPMMLDAFEEATRAGVEIPDRKLASQMRAFVIQDDGKPRAMNKGARGGAHDDVVMAAAIGWFLRSQARGPSRINVRGTSARDAVLRSRAKLPKGGLNI